MLPTPSLSTYEDLPVIPNPVCADFPILQHSDAKPRHSDLSLLAPSHVDAEQPVELSKSPSNADISQPILSEPLPQPRALRRSTRTRRQPRFLRDFHCQLATGLAAPFAPPIFRSTHSGNPYELPLFLLTIGYLPPISVLLSPFLAM